MNNHDEFNESKERAKELECLYLVEEAMNIENLSDALIEVSKVTQTGFSDVKNCTVTVIVDDKVFKAGTANNEAKILSVDICVNKKIRGQIIASYPFIENACKIDFLPQEEKLLKSIANKIANLLLQKDLISAEKTENNWREIVKLLQTSNQELLLHVCSKMLSMIALNQPKKAESLLAEFGWSEYNFSSEVNIPLENTQKIDVQKFSNSVFESAKIKFSDILIYENINRWIYQFKTYEIIKIINKSDSDINDILQCLKRYLNAIDTNNYPDNATNRWLLVELIRRFLTDQPSRIDNIRKYVDVESFCNLLESIIATPHNNGKIGGKATGIFLANQIVKNKLASNSDFSAVKTPQTWYILADEFDKLISANNLEELNEHKYLDIAQARILYPKIIQTIKNLKLSPYLLNALRNILDKCNGKPLIVRSSSMLEDQIGSSFSGKYKSLFIPYIGNKTECLKMVVDSILEIYASIFNPDAIQYRKEHNLLDCTEQMGIIIQEVVGQRVGKYYFPLYAGVAFSNNEFRWSPRIKRDDGLIRLVMGLGTRAVDRLKDDYPLLISPGQPNLTLNRIPKEIQKYSSRYLDVIDVENKEFLTLSIETLIHEFGNNISNLNHVVSILSDDIIKEINPIMTNYKKDNFVVTFDGLIKKTSTIQQINAILLELKNSLGFSVDIEFASDGEDLYILQCRPQSKGDSSEPIAIPSYISQKTKIFTANKYVSNGKVSGIQTVIFVDPEEYSKLSTYQDMINVGIAVGELNTKLVKKSFILIGPGRWGSRGDIKLGVPVTYSDICNTAMLIEVANEKSMFNPELSFGTHFFQDLVESGIHYLPLYPEDENCVFNMSFFRNNQNLLSEIAPDYEYLSDVIKVIDVPQSYFENQLIIRMNADLELAVAYLDTPDNDKNETCQSKNGQNEIEKSSSQGWKWRHYMAEKIADSMDLIFFGVKGIYLFGSTNSCSARLNSDIDLLIHIDATVEQLEKLNNWLNGWSIALAEINFLKTGYTSNGLLDIHYITDEDIVQKDSYATKIDCIYDPALLLKKREHD